MIAVLDHHRGATGHRVGDRLDGIVVRLQGDLTAALGVFHLDHAGELRDRILALRGTGFEKLGNTRETLGDIGCGSNATGVEGTQRQLGTQAHPMDCAATMPTASPTSTSLLVARDQP